MFTNAHNKIELTWHQTHRAVTGRNTTNTFHAICDITVITARSCMIVNAQKPSRYGVPVSTVL